MTMRSPQVWGYPVLWVIIIIIIIIIIIMYCLCLKSSTEVPVEVYSESDVI